MHDNRTSRPQRVGSMAEIGSFRNTPKHSESGAGRTNPNVTERKPPQRQQVLVLADAQYSVSDLLVLAKNADIVDVETSQLVVGEESGRVVPQHPKPDIDEVVYTERENKLVVLLGHHKVQQAVELERPKVKARFISRYNLKKAKI